MAKNNRTVDIASLQDPSQIKAVEYNPASGGQKSLTVGPRLIPIQVAAGWTTNASTTLALPFIGANLAIYNNAATAASVTTGDIGVTTLAIGATDANGNVGVACPPNAWTYISMGAKQYVVTSTATLITYIIEDPTTVARESGPFVQQFVNGTILPLNS